MNEIKKDIVNKEQTLVYEQVIIFFIKFLLIFFYCKMELGIQNG